MDSSNLEGDLQRASIVFMRSLINYREENSKIGELCRDLNPIQINLFTGEQTTEKLIKRIENWLSEIELGATS